MNSSVQNGVSEATVTATAEPVLAWWQGITRYQWIVPLMTSLGLMCDLMDAGFVGIGDVAGIHLPRGPSNTDLRAGNPRPDPAIVSNPHNLAPQLRQLLSFLAHCWVCCPKIVLTVPASALSG